MNQVSPAIKYAYPTGNINGLNLPDALSRLKDVKSQWWFYVGLLEDDKGNDHSFELTFIEPDFNVLLDGLSLTAVDFDFSFSSKEDHFHATSTYGGDEFQNVLQSVINSVGFSSVKSQDQDYQINVDLLSGTTVQVSYDAENSKPSASMYTGQIGQPGSAYVLRGEGSTWLWNYSKAGKENVAPYQYSLQVHIIDERGFVPEGLGSYVGVDPVHATTDTNSSSVEYAQPRLRVTGWEVTLTRHAECWPLSLWEQLEGFEKSYHFQSASSERSSYLWLDRQALFNAPIPHRVHRAEKIVAMLADTQRTLEWQQAQNIINEVKQGNKPTQPDSLASKLVSQIASISSISSSSKQLYLGCWLPVVLTKGAYAGATLLFVAFWKKARRIGNYDTDKGDASSHSFMNLYTGILGSNSEDTYAAYTMSDLLNPYKSQNSDSISHENNNYRIQFTKQFQRIGCLPDPERWACEIEVTVKAFTQARYALSAYAKRAGREEALGIDQDLTFTIKAVSPYTNTTMLSSALEAPIYEGASRIYMKDEAEEIGSGWVEQMVGAPSHQ